MLVDRLADGESQLFIAGPSPDRDIYDSSCLMLERVGDGNASLRLGALS